MRPFNFPWPKKDCANEVRAHLSIFQLHLNFQWHFLQCQFLLAKCPLPLCWMPFPPLITPLPFHHVGIQPRIPPPISSPTSGPRVPSLNQFHLANAKNRPKALQRHKLFCYVGQIRQKSRPREGGRGTSQSEKRAPV